MGFRFRKSFGKGPFRVTVSKSGVGYSVGGKGFRYTKKAGGGTRTTASIPGTGISYVSDSGSGKARSTSSKSILANTSPAKPIVSGSDTSNIASPVPASSSVISRHKYCAKCKKEIPLDAKVCPYCGKRWGSNRSGVPSRAWYLVPAALATWAVIMLVQPSTADLPAPTQPVVTMATEAATEQTKPTTEATATAVTPAVDPFAGYASTSTKSAYILNTDTKKFHEPGCSDADRIDDDNRKTFSGSRSDLIAQGYEPCGHCDP